jgi:hypothetical protein
MLFLPFPGSLYLVGSVERSETHQWRSLTNPLYRLVTLGIDNIHTMKFLPGDAMETLRSIKCVRIAAVSLVFCCLNAVAIADDREDFLSRLHSLHAAGTSLTLMIVPKGRQIIAAVTEERLRRNACLYDVASDGGVSFEEVLELIEHNAYPNETARSALQWPFDIRIGLIFKNGGDVVHRIYFEDSISGRTIRGYSTWKERSTRLWLGAQASFPDRLRAIAARPDVIGDNRDGCVRP